MLYDMKAGLSLEIDVIIGTTMRMAKKFGMEVPNLTAGNARAIAINGEL
jgi:ketopantoate reductase